MSNAGDAVRIIPPRMNTHRLSLVLSLLALLAGPVQSQSDGSPAPAEPAPAGAPVDAGSKTGSVDGKSPAKAAAALVAAEDAKRPSPPALHLGSFASLRAARFRADGVLDTGAGMVQLVDTESGSPLVPARLDYTKGPEFSVDWEHRFGDVTMSARMLATGSVRNGDERTKAIIHLKFINRTDVAHTIDFGLRVMPGGGDPELRPMPSLPFKPGAVFARTGNLITRDDSLLLTWVGLDPVDVNILPPPAAPDAPAALLSWAIPLEPQTARYLDIYVAGPNASGSVDESAWRDAITRTGFAQVEEQLIWQSRFRGYFADMELGDAQLRRVLIASVHLLRMYGDADREFRAFSDRPYGHPATDDGVPAEVLGIMAEWSFLDNGVNLVRELTEQAVVRGQGLSAERRLAFVHGLSRAVRLGSDTALAQQLAVAIRALVTEPAAVEPWLDPANVALDLQGILDWAGPAADGSGADYKLPELSWSPAPSGPVEATMLAMRRAMSADDGPAAWAAMQSLLARTNANGLGSTRADGEIDARFAMGMMALARSMFIEDHGDDLHVFPHIPGALVPYPGALDLTTAATHFGLAALQTHYVGAARRTMGVHVKVVANKPFGRFIVHVPFDCKAAEAKSPVGGSIELLPDGSIECVQDPFQPKGLRFNIKLAQE